MSKLCLFGWPGVDSGTEHGDATNNIPANGDNIHPWGFLFLDRASRDQSLTARSRTGALPHPPSISWFAECMPSLVCYSMGPPFYEVPCLAKAWIETFDSSGVDE